MTEEKKNLKQMEKKTKTEEASIQIGIKTFLTAVIILASLMLIAGILTRVVPTGSYDRTQVDSREIIVADSFHFTDEERLPIWHWITAPVESLFGSDGAMVIVIILFLISVSSAFSLLEKSNIISFVVLNTVKRFQKYRYLLLAIVVLLFMLMGAVFGTFEENIALVPVMIALAYCMGWDSLMGLGMSMLASCFGFTAAILNPFSIAITQEIADLPLYSGTGFRVIIFVAYYALVYGFLYLYGKKIEKNPERSLVYKEDADLRAKYRDTDGISELFSEKTQEEYHRIKKATFVFGCSLLLIPFFVILSNWIPILSDLILILIGVAFLLGGIAAAGAAGIKGGRIGKIIGSSVVGIAPGIVLILMAMSVKFIIYNGNIMDTVLYYLSESIENASPFAGIILIYLLILLLELFVGSSSAKAFLVMPLITPLSDLIGVTRQSSVLAFCFGDGFSNILYPTNPVLLICLGLSIINYTKWLKWTWKLQLTAFLMASGFLLLSVAMQYGPF